MSVVGVPMLLAPVLGPVLGGVLVTHLSWRWIFFVNLPDRPRRARARGEAPARRRARRGAQAAGPSRLDWRGLLLLSPGVALVVFGLSEVSTHGSVSLVRLTAGPRRRGPRRRLRAARLAHAGAASSTCACSRTAASRAAAITVFLVGAALFGSLLLLPLYFQIGRGLSPLRRPGCSWRPRDWAPRWA